MKKRWLLIFVVVAFMVVFLAPAQKISAQSVAQNNNILETMAKKKDFRLSKKVYRKLKGWWTDVSSGGYDRKITRKAIKVYSRTTGECIDNIKICGCKKVKGGYLIKIKNNRGIKSCYKYNKKADMMENYYMGWKADETYYSGSSSLFRGKWR